MQLWRSQPFAANVGSDFFMVGVVIEVHAVGRTHQLYTSVLSFLLSVNLKTNRLKRSRRQRLGAWEKEARQTGEKREEQTTSV